jgi:O-antigen ligase/Flp pilus assembly protein TadD
MTLFRRAAVWFLMASLALPALAMHPAGMHGFDVPKSALWEPLTAMAAALLWALPPRATGRSPALGWLMAGLGLAAALLALGAARFPFGALRAVEGAAAVLLGLMILALDKERALGRLPGLALGMAALWWLSAALSRRPDLAAGFLLDWTGYLLVFATTWVLAGKRDLRQRLLAALVLAAALNAMYALLQALAWDPLDWNQHFGGRPGGFFGNPDFLGGHLALLLPLALALALNQDRGLARRTAAWSLVWLFAAALLATQTRGAWLAAGLGCALTLSLAAGLDKAAIRRRLPVLVFSVSAFLLGAGLWWGLGASPAQKERLYGTLSADPEAGHRVFLMEKTAALAWSHPLLGLGPGCFRVRFPAAEAQGAGPYGDPDQPFVLSEHGHNDLLQMAADSGLPAACLWLLLGLMLWLRLARGLKRVPAREGLFTCGVLGALLALAVHGLANFPFLIVPTQSAAWALAALGLRSVEGEGVEPESNPPPARPWRPLLAGLALAAVLGGVRARQVLQDGLWWRGAGELEYQHPTQAGTLLKQALVLDPREDRLWSQLGQAQSAQGDSQGALTSLREAWRLNPYDPQTALLLGKACLEGRQYHEAWVVLNAAAAEAPMIPELWEPLALACYGDSRFEDAIRADDAMLHFNIHEEAAMANKAAALGSLGRLSEALDTLREAGDRFPHSTQVQLDLAVTLYKMKHLGEARKAWRRAARLSPGDADVKALRKVLKP